MVWSARSKAILVTVAFALLLMFMIFYATIGLSQYTCEVCVEFNGRSKCRTASGATKEEAVRTATDNACSFLTSGMTDSIRCASTLPATVKCKQ